jgi:glycine cleavage system aminomethyltransferase T
LTLIGPRCRQILSKVCALDFHPDSFPQLGVKVTSLAKTRQIIMRRDRPGLPAFSLAGAPSLAAYVWDTLLEAGREFGLVPIGLAALRQLEEAG